MDLAEIRKELSDYCKNKCDANCCKANSSYGIRFSPEIIEKLYGKSVGTIKGLEPTDIDPLTGNPERYIIREHCPRLKDNLCTWINDKERPIQCHEYPIFIREGLALIETRCPYIQENQEKIIKLLLRKKMEVETKTKRYKPKDLEGNNLNI